MDISVDMLGEAQKKIRKNDGSIVLRSGDVRRIDARVESVDCVVCIRFLNWVDTPLLAEILGELCRVSKTNLIVGIRHLVPIGNYKPFKSVQGMLCAIRQISRLIYRKNELVLHRKSQVDNILSGLGLRVVQTKVIERDKRGTSYNIYLLEK
jgi:ubiquinone/menaquinone biosynthesis C-methylase UbiE